MPRSLILDLFGDYLRYAGSEVKLGDITGLLGAFGMEPATVRVNMSRLKKENWFTTRRAGRETVYALSDHMLVVLDEGRERIFRRKEGSWQGRWTMVIYQVPESERAVREQLRKQLVWHGFGQLSPSTWLAPHDLFAEAGELAAEHLSAKVDVLWCGTGDIEQDRNLAARCWDVEQLADGYRKFTSTYTHLDHPANAVRDGRQALVERMHVIGDFRRLLFRDPQLPQELQSSNWPGDAAFGLFSTVHQQLGSLANAYVSTVIGQSVSAGNEVLM